MEFPYLKKFAEFLLQESAVFPATEDGLHDFLQDICDDRFLNTEIEKLRNLNKDSHNSVGTVSQLVHKYSARREEVLHFLPEYTNHCTTVESIHEDLENVRCQMLKAAFDWLKEQQQTQLDGGEDSLKALSEAAFEGTIIHLDGLILETNIQFAKMVGITREQLIGVPMLNLFYPEDRDFVLDKFTSGSELPYTARMVHTDTGELLRAEFYEKTSLYSGEPIRVVAVRDITKESIAEQRVLENREELQVANEELLKQIAEKEEIEQALKESERRFRLLTEYSTDIITVHSPEGYFLYVSPSVKFLLGYSPDELVGKTAYEFIHPGDVVRIQENHLKMINRMQSQVIAFRFKKSNGNYIWLESSGRPIREAHADAVKELHIVSRDITDRKKAESELEDKNEALHQAYGGLKKVEEDLVKMNFELEYRVKERTGRLAEINADLHREVKERRRAERMLKIRNRDLIKTNTDLDNFVYTASHDLRAPISNIEGLLAALAEELADGEDGKKVLLGLIGKSISRFKATIQDLTEISKIQRALQEDVQEVSLPEVLEETVSDQRRLVEETRAKMISDFRSVASIKFSKSNLRSIFYNLINNSLKYRFPGRTPQIRIKTEKKGKKIKLIFSDNGLGIPENQIEKVFTMFKRAHDHVEGSGVGLYIVKRIVENAGGNIYLESQEGAGTKFVIFLKM